MKVTFFSILLVTILLFITQGGHAETFRWIDESGKVRIGIKPPAKPVNIEKDKESNMEIPSSVIASPVAPKVIIEDVTPSTKTIKVPEAAATPAAKLTPSPIVTTPEIVIPTKAPVSVQPPKPVQKINIEKPKPVKKKVPIKKPVVKKVTAIKKKTAEERSARERNEEMCGVFTGYVNDYKEKVSNCSLNVCDIYKRSLARYKKKQTSYCK